MFPEPSATYRLQLRPGFGFDEAAEIAQYLADLGISHLYLSPYLQAASGSTHGYDIVDPGHVNSELGGGGAHARLCLTLKTAGLGRSSMWAEPTMAMGKAEPWWWDVWKEAIEPLCHVFRYGLGSISDRAQQDLPACHGRSLRLDLEEDSSGWSTRKGSSTSFPGERVPGGTIQPRSSLGDAADSCGSEVLAFLAQSHAGSPVLRSRPEQVIRPPRQGFSTLSWPGSCRGGASADAAINDEVALIYQDPAAAGRANDQQKYGSHSGARGADWVSGDFDIKDLVGYAGCGGHRRVLSSTCFPYMVTGTAVQGLRSIIPTAWCPS
jgi:(1->4)-alpha-D-glucan 1-alpha-D-glucosylmutase